MMREELPSAFNAHSSPLYRSYLTICRHFLSPHLQWLTWLATLLNIQGLHVWCVCVLLEMTVQFSQGSHTILGLGGGITHTHTWTFITCQFSAYCVERTVRRQNIQRDVRIYSETSKYTVRHQNIRCDVRIYGATSEYTVRCQNMRWDVRICGESSAYTVNHQHTRRLV